MIYLLNMVIFHFCVELPHGYLYQQRRIIGVQLIRKHGNVVRYHLENLIYGKDAEIDTLLDRIWGVQWVQ